MKGLELSESFYYECCEPMLREEFPEDLGRIAVGLAGPGSECFGFDDELSHDHDWGPCFCLWLTDVDAKRMGERLAKAYDALPRTFKGFGPRLTSPGRRDASGPAASPSSSPDTWASGRFRPTTPYGCD